ncbi:AfsR/SARP family transcriptional regulator [Catenuloplanes japonicus]|uniref:AfsR/SARP family transcriptional regulator n=1 Tax=Catenuloplanes japonicus TaxID=33876 RepID=UPI00068D0785|nr:BTAD domain-containing putative transcriptional regulator [Catenuloplanes japonicus]
MRLRILGPLRLRHQGREAEIGPRQQRCLLALLVARVGEPIGLHDLVDLIWGADPPASAVNVVHKYVGTLRRLLEPGLPPRVQGAYLARHGSGYLFTAGPDTLDLVAFRQLAARAAAGGSLDLYLEALRLGHGPAGDGHAGTPAAQAVFARLDREFCRVAVAAAEVALRCGAPARMVAPLRRAAEMAPFDEPVHAGLITVLGAAGHQAEALSAYRLIRTRLAAELGIDPGRELQEAQRRVLHQSVPATRTVRPAQLPPGLPVFTGRDRELASLASGPGVIAMHGMAGVGTSALAIRFAHEAADDYPDGQLYLDLRGDGEHGGALRSLLHGLGLRAPDVPETADAQAGAYRSLTAGKRLLVLLDNVQDAARVRPLLPASAGSLTLVTGRRPLLSLAAADGARLMRVDVPGLPAARELFLRRLPPRPADAAVVDEIVTRCGRLPSALAILAARLTARPGLSLAAVAAELRDDARRLDAFAGCGVEDPRTAFARSYRQLSTGAALLFRQLAAPGNLRAARTWPELSELADAALITEHDDGRFGMHELVRAYARECSSALRRQVAVRLAPPHRAIVEPQVVQAALG